MQLVFALLTAVKPHFILIASAHKQVILVLKCAIYRAVDVVLEHAGKLKGKIKQLAVD